MKQWYEELFQDFADNYDKESFTSGKLGKGYNREAVSLKG